MSLAQTSLLLANPHLPAFIIETSLITILLLLLLLPMIFVLLMIIVRLEILGPDGGAVI